MITDPKEAYPLSWPADYTRTRPQDRRPMASWKRTANQYREALAKELTQMGAPAFVISSNVPLTARGALDRGGVEPLDVGVAVYFSRKATEDFTWQDALGLHEPAPTEAQVQEAFRRLALLYHPDRGGDLAMFQALSKHRDNALRWITRNTHQQFAYVIANDQFREVRLNLAAIATSLKALRSLDRCGSTGLLERAFRGFGVLAADAGPSVETVRVGA